MVVFGVEGPAAFVPELPRGGRPGRVLQMASERTWKKNLGQVKDDYEAAGVKEYFVFDPTREYLEARILGFRRRGQRFRPIRPDRVGGMVSEELGLCLVPEGTMLRLVRPGTGELVLTREEQTAAERADCPLWPRRWPA